MPVLTALYVRHYYRHNLWPVTTILYPTVWTRLYRLQDPRGALALAGIISHVPVNFLHQFFTECPSFHKFTPNDSLFLLFDQNFPKNRSENFTPNVDIARILCNFTPNDLLLMDVTQWPFFARKLSQIALWFDVLVGTPRSWLPPPDGTTILLSVFSNPNWTHSFLSLLHW